MARVFWTPTAKSPAGELGFDVTMSEHLEITSDITTHPVETGTDVADHQRKRPEKLTLEVFVSNTPSSPENFVTPSEPRGFVESVDLADLRYVTPLAPPLTELNVKLYTAPPSLLTASGVVSQSGVGAAASFGALIGAAATALQRTGPFFARLGNHQGLGVANAAPLFAQLLTFPVAFSAAIETYDALTQLQADSTLVSVVLRDSVHDNMLVGNITKPRANEDGEGARYTVEFTECRIVETRTAVSPVPAEVRAKAPVTQGAVGAKDSDKASLAHQALTSDFLGGIGRAFGVNP